MVVDTAVVAVVGVDTVTVVGTVGVDTVMAVGMATVGTGDMDIEDMAVIMRTVLVSAPIATGMGILIGIDMGGAAGCQDIGNMVIGFPVIMVFAIRK